MKSRGYTVKRKNGFYTAKTPKQINAETIKRATSAHFGSPTTPQWVTKNAGNAHDGSYCAHAVGHASASDATASHAG